MAHSLATLLTHDAWIRAINLASNDVTSEGAHALVEALPHNDALRVLDLWDNKETGTVGGRRADRGYSHASALLQILHSLVVYNVCLWGAVKCRPAFRLV